MKHLYLSILFFSLLFNCSKSDDGITENPYLPNYGFDTQGLINTSLPEYSNLLLPGNSVVKYGYGINGFVLYHIGNGQYIGRDITNQGGNDAGPCAGDAVGFAAMQSRPAAWTTQFRGTGCRGPAKQMAGMAGHQAGLAGG